MCGSIEPFKKSLFDSNIVDIGKEMAEIGIDSILQDGILKDIPIVGIAVSLGKVANNIHDKNLLKQTLVFIQQFNSGQIDEEKLEKYKEELNNNFCKAESELGRVLILLDKIIDTEKAKNLAKLYLAYINVLINWNEFCEFSEINDRLFVNDIDIVLAKYQDPSGIEDDKIHNYQRLVSVGLIKHDNKFDSKNVGTFITDETPIIDAIDFTELGNKFCRIISN